MATFDRAVNGFNHNVNHRGRVFHVQTEDSGVNNPTIVTLLYVGGNILASKRTSYSELLTAANVPELVRQRMEAQHKEMLRNVLAGKYDGAEAAQAGRAYQPGQLADASAPAGADGPVSQGGAAPVAPRTPIPLLNEAPLLIGTPESPGETLFGEDLVSEKSLDEVILGYLAEETEG
jgi:hypothetical protein